MNAAAAFCLAVLNCALYVAYCRQVKNFRLIVGYFPNIARPQRYHEKMLWRKIFDHNPLFVVFCDKLATKDHLRKTVPDMKVPRTLWSGDCLRKAPREVFAANVVIKANHGSSFNYFPTTDESDVAAAEKLADGWLNTTYGKDDFEWGYFGVKKAVYAEERIRMPTGRSLVDMHFRCAGGKAIFAQVYLNNKTSAKRVGFFSPDGTPLHFAHDALNRHGGLPADFTLPDSFPDAVLHAERLSQGLDLIRVDFMTDGSSLYAGEMTVYPAAGVTRATPSGALGNDILVNPHWDLKKSWFLSTPQSGWKKLYAQALNAIL